MQVLQLGNTVQVIYLLVISSTDHRTGLEGATLTATISKNGAAFVPISGTISELGDGNYKIAPDADDADTLGPAVIHVEATGADPMDVELLFVDYDPLDDIGSILARLLTFGRSVTYVGPVSVSGDVILRQEYAYETEFGSALTWSSTGWVDLSEATLELYDPFADAAIGTAALSVDGETQTITVEITSEESEALTYGVRTYVLRAVFGEENVELAVGTLTVIKA